MVRVLNHDRDRIELVVKIIYFFIISLYSVWPMVTHVWCVRYVANTFLTDADVSFVSFGRIEKENTYLYTIIITAL